MLSTQDQVAEVWRELLDVDAVAVDQDFFELGGHSMLAVQVLYRLTEVTGVDMALEDFFELGTVEEVAAEVDRLRAGRPVAEPVFEGEL
ncbi:phosphopantetheine-binding protein [Streptomyces sp. NBC_00582]|uniref:phosphopantetheine-binding protein n=1 Tax=Streptomyces sp. NBC_00582 TaxID=2975783 RepID=UPI002E8037EC|nr:phosphopantetheine-binding protein [Streptomyces sp. NBC_00582]WUB63932.1 phosphopantetheine-binding protein [Streptomyces sp. NBC_00582]